MGVAQRPQKWRMDPIGVLNVVGSSDPSVHCNPLLAMIATVVKAAP